MSNWDNLSIREKNDIIKVAVRNGLTNLTDIKNSYNSFDIGGSLGPGDPPNDVNPLEYTHSRFPITENLDVSLYNDPDFHPPGGGNIEYMMSKYDDLPYYNNYQKPDNLKGKSVVVYNNDMGNATNEAIALDIISHGLREQDPYYRKKILKPLTKSLKKQAAYFADRGGLKGTARKEFKDSYVDGILRNALVKDEYRDPLNYWRSELNETIENNPEAHNALTEAYNYINPTQLAPITVTPHANGGLLTKNYFDIGGKTGGSPYEKNAAAYWKKAKPMYEELLTAGIDPISAAGILGNIAQESGFNPNAANAINGGHWGYLQNDKHITPWVKKNYGGYGHENQMRYLIAGLQGKLPNGNMGLDKRFNGFNAAMKGVNDPEMAAYLWERNYELSSNENIPERKYYAKYFYNQMFPGPTEQEMHNMIKESSNPLNIDAFYTPSTINDRVNPLEIPAFSFESPKSNNYDIEALQRQKEREQSDRNLGLFLSWMGNGNEQSLASTLLNGVGVNSFKLGGSTKETPQTVDAQLIKLFKDAGVDMRITSGKRGPRYKDDKSWHIQGKAWDMVPINGDFSAVERALETYAPLQAFMVNNGLGYIPEWREEVMAKTKATGKHVHIGPDSKYRDAYARRVGGKINKYAMSSNLAQASLPENLRIPEGYVFADDIDNSIQLPNLFAKSYTPQGPVNNASTEQYRAQLALLNNQFLKQAEETARQEETARKIAERREKAAQFNRGLGIWQAFTGGRNNGGNVVDSVIPLLAQNNQDDNNLGYLSAFGNMTI